MKIPIKPYLQKEIGEKLQERTLVLGGNDICDPVL